MKRKREEGARFLGGAAELTDTMPEVVLRMVGEAAEEGARTWARSSGRASS